MKPNKCYIAGPMTGYKYFNIPTFLAKEDYLTNWTGVGAGGFVNPGKLDAKRANDPKWYMKCPNGSLEEAEKFLGGATLREILKEDLSLICDYCSEMYMLRGWEKSSGARTEWALANALGIKVYYE